jgi:hypothetical protein
MFEDLGRMRTSEYRRRIIHLDLMKFKDYIPVVTNVWHGMVELWGHLVGFGWSHIGRKQQLRCIRV